MFGGLSGGSMAVGGLALAIALFILQKEIVADIVDRNGDERVGLRTLPILLGAPVTMVLVAGINLAFLATVAVSAELANIGSPGRQILAGLGALNCVAALAVTRWCRDSGPAVFLTGQKIFLLGSVLLALAL